MLASSIPPKFQQPFANTVTSPYVTYPIPNTASSPNASLAGGFPLSSDQPGGAPLYADFQGILKQVSAWCQWAAVGGPIVYDATFSGEIGGYPQGCILLSADQTHQWISTADNNTTNPDTGGAGWSRFPVMAQGSLVKFGSATLPASGAATSTVAVTFSTAFPNAVDMITLTGGGTINSTGGGNPILGYGSITTGGFNINADSNSGQFAVGSGRLVYNQTVPVLWKVEGH